MTFSKLFCAAFVFAASPFLCCAELTIASFAYSENVVFHAALEVLGWNPLELDFEKPSVTGSLDPYETMEIMADTARGLGLEARWVDVAENTFDLSRGPVILVNPDASLEKRKAERDAYAKRADRFSTFDHPGADSCFLIAIALDSERNQIYTKFGGSQGHWRDRATFSELLAGPGLQISGRAPNPGPRIWNDVGVAHASIANPKSELTLFNVGTVPLRFITTDETNPAIELGLPEVAVAPGNVARIPINVTVDPQSKSAFMGTLTLADNDSPEIRAKFTIFEDHYNNRHETVPVFGK